MLVSVHKEQEMPNHIKYYPDQESSVRKWIKKRGPFIYLEVMPWSELLEHLLDSFGKLLQPVLRSEVR